jgi:acyl dehydratase
MSIKFDDFNVKDEIPSLDKGTVTHNQIIRYAGASGDFNPIHNDPEFAKSVGLDGTIAHGMLIMGLVGHLVSDWAGVDRVKGFKVAFKAMTLPGEKIICKGKVKKKKEENGEKLIILAVTAENDSGEVKVSGDAVIRAD